MWKVLNDASHCSVTLSCCYDFYSLEESMNPRVSHARQEQIRSRVRLHCLTCKTGSGMKFRKWELTSTTLRLSCNSQTQIQVLLAATHRSSSTLNYPAAPPEHEGDWIVLLLRQTQDSVSAWESFRRKAGLQHRLAWMASDHEMCISALPEDSGKAHIQRTTYSRRHHYLPRSLTWFQVQQTPVPCLLIWRLSEKLQQNGLGGSWAEGGEELDKMTQTLGF